VDGTTQRVEEVHQAVARRSFAVYGPARRWPEAVHDRVSARVYATIRSVGPAAIRSSALGLGAALDPDAERARGTPRGKAILSAVNGVFGESLARRRNGLALPMAIRSSDGADVQLTPQSLAQAFPHATSRIAVFVHGFGETDDSWWWFAHSHWDEAGVSYGELLRRERGFTPLYLHYNSGRPIAENGAELSTLLEAVFESWPASVNHTVLVGHSAGGLVARAAVADGAASGARWVPTVSEVFTLGTPRSAVALERTALAAARTLGRLPETRPLSELLGARSAGLKDLHDGSELPLPATVRDVRLPGPGVAVSHFKLLNHPLIYNEIKARLTDRTAPGPERAVRAGRSGWGAKALRARTPSRRR
jgi:pimeloyl-ACP methyl ester carboxylesterase